MSDGSGGPVPSGSFDDQSLRGICEICALLDRIISNPKMAGTSKTRFIVEFFFGVRGAPTFGKTPGEGDIKSSESVRLDLREIDEFWDISD